MRLPAEWEPHAATWIAWPFHEPDWPGKLEPVQWVYAEIVRALHRYERVEILCHSRDILERAREQLTAHDCNPDAYRLHVVPMDRTWLRDSAPSFALEDRGVTLLNWAFNGWAKYGNYARDLGIGAAIERLTHLERVEPMRHDGKGRLVLEGGGIEVNGRGAVIVTEEWLLSDIQVRNPGYGRADYERAFRDYLGAATTIWLGEGCVGDDTHGHVDDIARFCSTDTILLAHEPDPSDDNHHRSADNVRRLARDYPGFRVRTLPFPRAVMMDGQRLPASYANFYVANGVVIVPTFNDVNDRIALDIIAASFPGRDVIGIHAVDLVWGLGTLHCLTQQQPLSTLG